MSDERGRTFGQKRERTQDTRERDRGGRNRRRRGRRGASARDPDITGRRQLGAGFVVLVGLSGGLMAIQGGAPLEVIGAVTLGSFLLGGGLLWYLSRIMG
ncbi:hypothetical protein G6M89_01415 [Natronolimnobius sp. AArcel1]|uniref:hypothetical protein n=1 Tax=Natronolimnobius sp. AArcel1 TaxID=1679093 RepID=UPI0013ECBBAF|nr:hypothetical protein [Natronolimnobius sp. AArcel1]NGM67679.1 hypothetical protein [Natronolimnobius sp. AArcel1]